MGVTLEALHEQLNHAESLLDQAAGQIREIPLEPVSANVRRIGEILAQIFELHTEIYKLRPELIPTHLWGVTGPNANPSIDQIIHGAFRRAETAESNGDYGLAIQLIEFLLQCQPSGAHVGRALSEINRLKNTKNAT